MWCAGGALDGLAGRRIAELGEPQAIDCLSLILQGEQETLTVSVSSLTIDRWNLPDHSFSHAVDFRRGYVVPLWTARWLLAVTICLAPSASNGAAQWAEIKMQKPWAYTYRVDEADSIEFMATTPAIEDANVWLLLACGGGQRFYVSLMHSEQFPFAVGEKGHLMLQLDNSEPISVPSAVIEQKQITAAPQAAQDLIPVLVHGNRLVASINDVDGAVHAYSFALQPNDLALRDINIHCAKSGHY